MDKNSRSQYIMERIHSKRQDCSIIDIPKKCISKIRINTKYGICVMRADRLMSGCAISSRSAVDKNQYIQNVIHEIHPNIEILNNISSVKQDVIVRYKDNLYKYIASNLMRSDAKVKFDGSALYDKKNEFIAKFIENFGDKYDYSKTQLTNINQYITVTCLKHGDFKIRGSAHLYQNQGCLKCAREQISIQKTSTSDEFIKKSTRIHGEKYNYSQVKYKGNRKVVDIICSEHGIFKQKPVVHLQGSGCPLCASSCPDSLYLLYCNKTSLYKIGVSKGHPKDRVRRIYWNSKIKDRTIKILHYWEDASSCEKKIHKYFSKNKQPHPFYSDGESEWFKFEEDQKYIINTINNLILKFSK